MTRSILSFRSLALLLVVMVPRPVSAQQPIDTGQHCQQILLFGAVRKPARLDLRRPTPLFDLLTLVGGFDEKVGRYIHIIQLPRGSLGECDNTDARKVERRSDLLVETIDVVRGNQRANVEVQPGDIVQVTEIDTVYISGEVDSPRGIALAQRMTITQALSVVGGPKVSTEKVVIKLFRHLPGRGDSTITKLLLKDIESDPSKDILLEAFDIIHVSDGKGEFKNYFLQMETPTDGPAKTPKTVAWRRFRFNPR